MHVLLDGFYYVLPVMNNVPNIYVILLYVLMQSII